MAGLKLRRAARRRKRAVSAVAAARAGGAVLETWILWAVQVGMSILWGWFFYYLIGSWMFVAFLVNCVETDGPGMGLEVCGSEGGWRETEYVLVVSGAIVSDEAHIGFSECFDDFSFYPSGDGDTAEGAVDGFGAIEGAGLTFLEEVGWVGGLGGDEMGERGKGVVCGSSWGTVGAFKPSAGGNPTLWLHDKVRDT